MDDELLTTTQVAEKLGVTVTSMNRWLKLGDFPNAYRLNPTGRRSAWRIPKGDVDLFIKKRTAQRGYFYVPVARE